jgi:hypothetical protein
MKDLFETPELIPSEVQLILEYFKCECTNDYLDLERLINELEEIGYTLDYGLDAEPFGLRPIDIKLEQLEGYE